MRLFILLVFLISALFTSAQTGKVFVGKKRTNLQTELRGLIIDEYEQNHTGYKQGDDIWLYIFFEKNICIRHYWLVYSDKKEQVIADFEKEGWTKQSADTLVKENYTCTIQSLNEGKNLIFLVEQTSEPVVAKKGTNQTGSNKNQASNSKSQNTNSNSKSSSRKYTKKEEEPQFQGLRILGWEVIKLEEGEE